MFNRYGLLTRSNKSEVQETVRDPEIGKLLHDLYIQDGPAFLGDLNGWCTTSSWNRCCFYMGLNYENKIYAQKNRNIPYILLTYGVKGMDAISRDMKYVNQYLQSYDDMRGGNFVDYVFGTDYVAHEEPQKLITKAETIERLRRKIARVSRKVENEELVCRLIERIWTAREQDAKTRVLLVLEHAGQESINLLRQIYLMLPQVLRMQTGFMTNVLAGDLDVISRYALPIYILTVDRADVESLSSAYLRGLKFPVEFIEIDSIKEYPCDPGRLALLREHSAHLSEIVELCMNYTERKVMEANGQDYSSFRIYGDILDMACSEELFWWEREDLGTVEQICTAYYDQMELMKIPELKKEAVSRFYMKQIPEGDLAAQILQIACDTQYPDRAYLLDFLSSELCFGKELEAVEAYVWKRNEELSQIQEQMRNQHETELETLRAEDEEKLNLLKMSLLDEKEREQRKHEEEIQRKNEELQRIANEKEREIFDIRQELHKERSRTVQIVKISGDLQKKLQDLDQQVRETGQVQDYDSSGNSLKKDERKQDLLKEYGAEKKNNEILTEKVKRAEKIRNVFGTLTIVFAAAAAVSWGVSLMKAGALHDQLAVKETELLYQEKMVMEQEQVIAELKSQNENRDKEIERLKASVTAWEEKSKQADNEDGRRAQTGIEEDTESATETSTEGVTEVEKGALIF